ncbi:MAG: hypothetical protein JXB17_03700, partial [Bacteroidales bacterium]|nr:hypothetical protein [Bacteroidales bacterium]
MKNKYLFTYILLGVLTFLFYGNTFKNEYTLDDAIVITKNQFTKSGLKGIKDILTHDTFTGFFGVEKKLLEGGRYRPLSLITFAIEYELFGLNPHISHLINILLYLFLCVIIYYFFNLLFKEENQENKFINLSFLATLLFLAHPIHTEVVANIKGRDEILSLIGSVGAAISVFRYLKNEKKKHLFYSFLWFIVGIFSKENTITFLAVIPLSIFFFTNTTPKKFIISIVPAALATASFLIIRKIVFGNTDNVVTELMNNPFLNATINQKYATIMYTWGLYLKLLVFPHPLTFDYYPYHIALTTWNNKWVIVSALVILIILILALINTKKRPIPSFAILFFFITFSIVSNVLFPVGTFMNERFMFVPSLGFCLLFAYFFIKAIHIKPKSNIHKFSTLFIITVILSLFFIKTYTRNKAWKDDFTLFSTDVKTSANSAKSNTSYGGNLLEKSAMEEDSLKKMEMQRTAIFHLRKAVEIHPKYVDALILLGNAYAGYKNMNDSAMFFYKTAL